MNEKLKRKTTPNWIVSKVHFMGASAISKPDPYREKFVKYMRSLFLKAGFDKSEVAIQGPTEEGPDIIITAKEKDRSYKILVQCKWAKKEGKEFRELDKLIKEYRTFISDLEADAALLAFKNYVIPPSFMEKDKMDKIKQKDKIIYWNDNIIAYYRKTVNTIGKPYTRYIILKDFGFKIPIRKKPYKVKAVKIKQHSRNLYLFSIEPEKLLKLAYVSRRDMRDPWAYQRLLRPKKLKDLAKFVSKTSTGESGLLANNIVLAFEEDGVDFTGRTLKIPAVHCSVLVVDGQHRLYGFAPDNLKKIKLLEEEKRELQEEYPLACVGIKDLNQRVQAKLFREINEFQKKIDRNLLLDLFHHLEIGKEKNVWLRVDMMKDLRRYAFFKDRIKILSTDKGNISLATFVDYPGLENLVKNHGRRSKKILKTYFESVSKIFDEEWNRNPERYVLSTNRGVRILISLLNLIIKCKGANKPNFRRCLKALTKVTSTKEDYFNIENYKGKAYGAGAPADVAVAVWAKEIKKTIPNFPCEGELNPDAYALLKELENELRECIQYELGKISEKWWKQRIPQDIRDTAEERKKKNKRPWPWLLGEDLHPIYYINFTDYRKIIIRKPNWRDAFKDVFKDKDIIGAWLKELEPIRNAISHPRKLSSTELKTLQLYHEKILALIRGKSAKDEITVPQANDLDKVVKTAISVIKKEKSEESFLVGRQGRYHKNAAEILGLVQKVDDSYVPTELGDKFVKAPSKEREEMLLNLVRAVPIIKQFLSYSLNEKKFEWKSDEIANFIRDQVKLSEATAKRRSQTIVSWLVRIGVAKRTDSLILLQKTILES